MGYRLCVENESKTLDFYGTKHYGYSFAYGEDGFKYPSYQYLFKLKKVTGEEFFTYGLGLEITLTAEEFEHFIKLYAQELEDEYGWQKEAFLQDKEIAALLNNNERKIISWG